MRIYYAFLSLLATALACTLLGLQIHVGLDYNKGGSPVDLATVIVAMVTVAVLPIFIDAAWRLNKAIALALFIGFCSLLVYSLPATVGRLGEVKEVKVLAAIDAADTKARLADVARTLDYAEPEAKRECAGAPDPIPKEWPECRRKTGTVAALREKRDRLQADLRAAGKDRLGDLGSDTMAWLLTLVGVKADAVRKGSVVAFALGSEVLVWALVWLATVAARQGFQRKPAETKVATPATVVASPPTGGSKGPVTRPEALADLKTLLKIGQQVPSQDWLKERWGLSSKGTISKWVSEWEAEGEIPNRIRSGKCNTIAA